MTLSPGLATVIMAAIMASVLPQVATISLLGSMVTAHEAALLFGQRLAEVLRAPGDGVLVEILVGDLGQAVQNSLGRVEVREALGQVDRAVLVGDAGHPPDDRIRKMRCARG